jgi:hypothetical protein
MVIFQDKIVPSGYVAFAAVDTTARRFANVATDPQILQAHEQFKCNGLAIEHAVAHHGAGLRLWPRGGVARATQRSLKLLAACECRARQHRAPADRAGIRFALGPQNQ